MAAGSIVIDLLMKTGSFETDTKRAEARLKQLEKEAVRAGKAIGLAFLAAAGATAALVKSSINAADAAAKMARSAGMTVEAFTELSFAAELAGVNQDEFTTAMGRLARTAKDADDGVAKSARAFADLGVKLRDGQGNLKSTEQLLGEVADALAKLPDGVEKTARAQEIFGRSGARFISLLNGGSSALKEAAEEARQLGLVLSQDTAQAAERFNDDLTRLGKLARGFGNDLATALLPVLTDISGALVQAGKDARASGDGMSIAEGIARAFTVVLQALSVTAANVAFVFAATGREIGAWAAQIAALGRGDLAGFRAISDAVKDDARRARAELDAFERRVMALTDRIGASSLGAALGANSALLNPPPRGGAPRAAGGGAQARKAREPAAEISGPEVPRAFADAMSRIQMADESKLARLREELAEITSIIAAGGAVPDSAITRLVDEIADLDPAARQAAEAQRALRQAMDDGRSVFLATRQPAEILAAEIERLNRLLQQGAIDWDTYARAQFQAQDRFEEAVGATLSAAEDTTDIARQLGLTFSSAFEDAIVKGGKFSDVLRGIEQDILRIVTRSLVTEPLGNALTGLIKGLGGGGAGGAGGLLSSIGSSIAGLFGGMFADGGYLPPGQWGIAGERGPEPIFGGRTGLTVQPAGGGAVSVVNHFHISGAPDMRTQQQIAAAASRGVQRAAARNN